MSKVLRTLRPASTLHSFKYQKLQHRSFITLPGSEPQSLTATRILPYSSKSLYKLIADVDSYSTFVPYCLDSRVTKWSNPDKDGKRWPSEAELKVGWGGMEETFTSRLFCIPGSVVEALSGDAVTSLPRSELAHHGDSLRGKPISNSVFKSLSTTWRVKPFQYKAPSDRPQTDRADKEAQDRTEVSLDLDFSFSNPIYAALSKAVAPKVAGIMIEAFEIRARRLLEGNGSGYSSSQETFRAEKKAGL